MPKTETSTIAGESTSQSCELQSKLSGNPALQQFSDWLDAQLEQMVQSQSKFASPVGTRKSLGR